MADVELTHELQKTSGDVPIYEYEVLTDGKGYPTNFKARTRPGLMIVRKDATIQDTEDRGEFNIPLKAQAQQQSFNILSPSGQQTAYKLKWKVTEEVPPPPPTVSGVDILATTSTTINQWVFGSADIHYRPNTIFQTQNSLFSKNRWGIGANYSTSIASPTSGGMTNLNTDLEYRLLGNTHWTKSTELGLGASYGRVQYAALDASLLGVKGFIYLHLGEKGLPILNKISWFRKPHSLFLQGRFYSASMSSSRELTGSNFDLQLQHRTYLGQYWHISFVPEFKSYNYQEAGVANKRSISVIVLSLGLGAVF